MNRQFLSLLALLLALAAAAALLAYLDPANAWRWSYMLSLCQ